MNALDMLHIDDLSEEQRELADIVGMDAYKSLVHNYGGTAVYIPKLDTIERQQRNERIKNEYYKGKSLKVLAIQYNLTETQIRTILTDIYVRKTEHIVVGQLSMFEE